MEGNIQIQNVEEEDTYFARPFSSTYCSSADQSMTKDGNASPVVLVLGGKEWLSIEIILKRDILLKVLRATTYKDASKDVRL